MNFSKAALFACILSLLIASQGCQSIRKDSSGIKAQSYRVLNTYPHDRKAQTEGLVFLNGFLYEGTGPGPGVPSSLRRVEIKSGKVLSIRELQEPLFGEGITIYKNRIIQLTYKAKTGFVYDRDSFTLLEKFSYSTEGWGLTHDGSHIIMSDGTSTLYFLDPVSFKIVKRLQVYDYSGPVNRLNELEYIRGEIYANIFETSRIVRLSPQTGRVIEIIDLSLILKDLANTVAIDLANGIAYDGATDRLFVTGKFWPRLFELKIFQR